MGLLKAKIKLTLIIIVIIAAVLGGLYLGAKLNLYEFPFDFGSKPLTIENTANVITEIKKIGEFTTACFYEEIAMQNARVDTVTILGIERHKHHEIVLIGKGRVRAGFDLAKIQESDMNAHGDTLDLTLPHAEIFDIILNPSDFDIEYESGDWDNENTKPIKAAARKQLEEDAIAGGIQQKAETSGLERLKNMFTVFGYKVVNLSIKE